MRCKFVASVVLFAALAPCMMLSQTALPHVYLVSPTALAQEKAHPSAEELRLVRQAADKALRAEPMSVTAKSITPPSGDKHDYMSMGRYWWPNPDTPGHLPYIRRDGESNPEIDNVKDHEALTRTAEDARALALGWYITGDARYAEHATLLLKAFFLDPKTAMNPNLEFAQAVPGHNTGRGAGILDARGFAMVVDAVGMLEGSKAWTADDDARLKQWFNDYYKWMTTSAHGKQEMAAPNNHGSWYAEQQASIAQLLGRKEDVLKIAQQVRDQRIPSQFDAQGMQKYELVRTNSFSYSAFNLQALTQLANIVSSTGVDLYKTIPGILTGIDALLPYDTEHKWPHQQISKGKESDLCPALLSAGAHTKDAKYAEAQKRFGCKQTGETLLADPEEH